MVRPPPMHPDRLAWGSIPAVGLLARGLWALAFPGFCPVAQVRPFTAYSCGGSSGLTGKPAHRIPCYPLAGTVGVSALANRLPPVEPQASMVACRAFRESHADTQRTADLDRPAGARAAGHRCRTRPAVRSRRARLCHRLARSKQRDRRRMPRRSRDLLAQAAATFRAGRALDVRTGCRRHLSRAERIGYRHLSSRYKTNPGACGSSRSTTATATALTFAATSRRATGGQPL